MRRSSGYCHTTKRERRTAKCFPTSHGQDPPDSQICDEKPPSLAWMPKHHASTYKTTRSCAIFQNSDTFPPLPVFAGSFTECDFCMMTGANHSLLGEPCMRAIVTGQVGVDKGPYLEEVRKAALAAGHDLEVC